MDKPGIIKRGIIKKVKAQGRSPNIVLKKKLQAVQETIGRLRVEEFKVTEKFLGKEDLRPKLRKSMLIRAVENAGKHIISSTPHPTRKTDDQPFFGNNHSVMLSPISLESGDMQKKKELLVQIDIKDQNKCKEKSSLQKDTGDSSQKELFAENLNTPEKHNSSVVYVGTETYEDHNEKSLRKCRKDQSSNRNRINGEKLTPDKSFDSEKNPHKKEADKSPEEVLARIRGKSPLIKNSKIPVRTASQENTLISPDKTHEINYLEKTPNKKKSVREEEVNRSANKDKNKQFKENASVLQKLEGKCLSPRTHSTNKKEGQKCSTESQITSSKSTGTSGPDENIFNKQIDLGDKEISCPTNKDKIVQPNKNMADIVLQNLKDPIQSPQTRSKSRKERKENSAKSCMVSSKSPQKVLRQDEISLENQTDNVNANNKNNNEENKNLEDYDGANSKDTSRAPEALFQDHLVNNETDFVNKTPRKVNNQTLELQNPVSNKNIPLILTEEPDNGKNMDLINKSRPSAVRDRAVGLSEVSTKSIGLSPIIGYLGQNKRKNETEILQHTKGEKSVAFSLADENSCMQSETCDRSPNIASRVEDTNANPLERLIAEISAKKKNAVVRTSAPSRRTVNVQVQTSMNEKEYSYRDYKKYRRTRHTSSRVSRLAKRISVEKLASPDSDTSHSKNSYYSNVTSSSGAASDVLTYIHEARRRSFKYNIFESLEEGNELDALDFSDSGGPELSAKEKPWRFVNDGLVTENSDRINLSFIPTENQINNRLLFSGSTQSVRNRRDNSFSSSNDSGHSSYSPKNETLKYSKSSSRKLFVDRPKLNNSNCDTTTSSKPKTRRYTRRCCKTTDGVHKPSSNISKKDQNLVSKSFTRTKSKNQKTMEQVNQSSKIDILHNDTPAGETFISKASRRSKKNDKNLTLESPTNNDESILSADKELLGVRRLSFVPTGKEFNNKRSLQKITPTVTEPLADKELVEIGLLSDVAISTESNNNRSVQKITPMVREESVDKGLSKAKRLSEIAVSKESSNSHFVQEKLPADTVQERNHENKILSTVPDILVPAAPITEGNTFQKTSNAVKKKRNTKWGINDCPTDLGFTNASSVNQYNILESGGNGRPQRNRKPVRYLTDIVLDEITIQVVKKKPTKKKLSSVKKSLVPPVKKSIMADSGISTSNEKNLQETSDSKNCCRTNVERSTKVGTKKMGRSRKKTKKNNIPLNCEENLETIQNADIYVRSNDEHETSDPKNCSRTNVETPTKVGTKKIERPRRKTKQNDKALNCEENLETIQNPDIYVGSNDDGNNGSKDFPAPESFQQPKCPDRTERTDSENRISTTDQSLTKIKTGGVTKTHIKPNVAKVVADTFSQALEKESTRNLEQSTAFFEQTNMQSCNASKNSRASFESTTLDHFKYMKDGEFVLRMPSDADYKRIGALDVTQPIKDPNKRFSAGYIRLRPGQAKQATVTTKYYFIFNVMKGEGCVKRNDQSCIVKSLESFIVMLGEKYSIQNTDSESDLVLFYTKMA